QAVEVLARGMEDPLDVAQGLAELLHHPDRGRVEQEGARALTKHLDEIGALRIAVAGCPFRIDRRRTGALCNHLDRGQVRLARIDHAVFSWHLLCWSQRLCGMPRVGHASRPSLRIDSDATPSAGGRPASMQRSSPQPSTCAVTSESA